MTNMHTWIQRHLPWIQYSTSLFHREISLVTFIRIQSSFRSTLPPSPPTHRHHHHQLSLVFPTLMLSNTLATWCKELTHLKRPWCWERLKVGGEGDDRGWDGWMASIDGHEFEQAPGVGDGQGSLACCSPWGHKELDMTEQLNWTDLLKIFFLGV